jgi:type 1 glutamine amidotransferase
MKASKWAIGLAAVLSACSAGGPEGRRSTRLNGALFSALIFSKTTGYRHDSIPNGIAAITELGAENGFNVDATEDSTLFTEQNLANYQVVIFLNTTGNVLNDDQKAAFQQYIEGGNGYVGIHSATDTEYNWKWYGQLVGAYFRSHPAIQTATIQIEDPDHPSTVPLPQLWERRDEWYNFQSNPRETPVHVLATMDENSYQGGDMIDHPIAWCHDVAVGGRSWYTALGHTQQSYDEPLFRQHLLGGILSTAGAVAADCSVAP